MSRTEVTVVRKMEIAPACQYMVELMCSFPDELKHSPGVELKDLECGPVYGNLWRWLTRRPQYWQVTAVYLFPPGQATRLK